MVAVISCCTVQIPKQPMFYSRYMLDEISYHTIKAIIYLARVTSCLSDSDGHDRRWLRMSGITPDTKLRLRKVTARFLNCDTCTQGRVLSFKLHLIVIVFKPAILTAPAPRTSWHVLELNSFKSSATFSPTYKTWNSVSAVLQILIHLKMGLASTLALGRLSPRAR